MITKEKFNKACECLIDNGIEEDEAQIVCQAMCYILCDEDTERFMGNVYTEKVILNGNQMKFAHNLCSAKAAVLASVKFEDGATAILEYKSEEDRYYTECRLYLNGCPEEKVTVLRTIPEGKWSMEWAGDTYILDVDAQFVLAEPFNESEIELEEPDYNEEDSCNTVNWYIPINFDPDAKFGMNFADTDDYINLYLNYNISKHEVIELYVDYANNCAGGIDWGATVILDENLKKLLKEKAEKTLSKEFDDSLDC